MNKYLGREDAPIGADTWKVLDETMSGAAKGVLAGRRLLHIEGPYGLGLKAMPLQDCEIDSGFVASPALPIMLIQSSFSLGKRDLAAYEQNGVFLDTGEVARAAMECARLEDALVFKGVQGVGGLLTVEGAKRVQLSRWAKVGAATDDVIKAVTALDEAGFHGPYSLALAPARYNLLFHLYAGGAISELEHIKTIVSEGVVKAPILDTGGLLLTSGGQFASIVLGQDMTVGFVGPSLDKLDFSVSETLALRMAVPSAFCILGE